MEKNQMHDMISIEPLTKILKFIVQDLELGHMALEWKYI